MGRVPTDWEDAGRFSSLGDMAADRADATAEQVKDMDVPYHGGGNGGRGHSGGGGLCQPPAEHRRIIYRDKSIMDLCLEAARRTGAGVLKR